VSDTRSYRFRSRPEAVTAARRALDGFERLLDLGIFYDASLCVSELVTNAVLHAGAGPDEELELEVALAGDVLKVAVTDPGPGFGDHVPLPGDESGWGLYIVDRLADRWGVDRGDRTRVWFEMGVRAEVARERREGQLASSPDQPAVSAESVERAPRRPARRTLARLWPRTHSYL
jgi:anti-sigma regulatory factor (Ser/Thr protein kinase)